MTSYKPGVLFDTGMAVKAQHHCQAHWCTGENAFMASLLLAVPRAAPIWHATKCGDIGHR